MLIFVVHKLKLFGDISELLINILIERDFNTVYENNFVFNDTVFSYLSCIC